MRDLVLTVSSLASVLQHLCVHVFLFPVLAAAPSAQCDQMWRFRANVALFGVPLARKILEVALAPKGEKSGAFRKF